MMIRATKNDKDLIVRILSRSFDANQSVNYIVRQDNKRKERIAKLMSYSFEICSLFGDVWLSEDKSACALVLYPQNKRTTLKSIILDIKLIWQVIGIGNIIKTLNRESSIKAKQPKQPMAYVWFIGVNPEFQHQGKGSRLLRDLLADAREKDLPVFLETSTVRNLPWYESYNFKIYDQLDLTYKLFFLKQS
ncbi:GNAT family N-acetyltransferase [Mucilaginibacter aquaedulcis]|uniref:GNAT family N-acetyltransferase n=1 Tax=Mucilaginibacter aquaedulcis TaxID=1187081 RepID=UPI0025B2EFAE|nr:GNAT family N-acetyltransferase [Mucilaginibacter aquaedulcis]MDN3548961.1 GNAT family N-acetyltransferase [Mucilaginibacter aquaedulcis]